MATDNKGRKTVYKSLSLIGCGFAGSPCAVDVEDDKIVRVRPLHFDSEYAREKVQTWQIERNGKVLEAPDKGMPSPWSLGYKKRAYSPNRIQFPLKRVDWDPNGERNTQNRGISKYKRISWDEATDIIAGEIRRIHKEYGPLAILGAGDGHGEDKLVHAPHGEQFVLLESLGGYTQQGRNPDSWEGWYWGTRHVWGKGAMGVMAPATNVLYDVSTNAEMVLFWGCDPETTPWGFQGQYASKVCYFWTEAGIDQIYICPDLNYGAAIHADKWIPILPNTDAALQLAIIYTWLTEGTWDKEFVATHAVGMDKIEDYVLGKEDGFPKTPAWASEKCGVPEWTIKALAREFARLTTTIAHYNGGSLIRGPYSTEPARLEAVMLGMQGLGGPGVHQMQFTNHGNPRSAVQIGYPSRNFRTGGELGWADRVIRPHAHTAWVYARQNIPKDLFHEAVLSPPITFWGTGGHQAEVADQYLEYTYPIAKEEGGTEIHMVWTDTPCLTTCWNDGNRMIEAYRSPKLECIVAQHPWLENDCVLADIILPVSTTFEEDDLAINMNPGFDSYVLTLNDQAISPIGESMSDYEVVAEIAKKLDKYEEFTGGKTVQEWVRHCVDKIMADGLEGHVTWEELREKGYFVYPAAEDWRSDPPGLSPFHYDPIANPLPTPTGKLEFYSESLAKTFPDDEERPPIPKWVEKGITHDERLSSDRAKRFPLLMMSNHGRWRTHSQADDICWTREAETCKVKGPDGYLYEPLWINTITAAERGISNGDIVKAYNERGAVLCGAYVTERLMPGVAYVDHGSRCDWIIPGQLDRGGAINLISPRGITSKHAGGMATSGYLVEVEKVTSAQMEEWKSKYPAAFNRPYDPGSGLRFDAWVEDGI